MITLSMLLLLAVFAFRLIQIQAIDSENLAARALDQRLVTAEIAVPRADILDRDGVVLATSVDRYHVWVDQREVADWKRTLNGQVIASGPSGAAEILAPILGIDAGTLEAALTGDSRFTYIARNVAPETWSLVRAEGILGVEGEPTSTRIYPNGDVAGNVVGFVGGVSDRQGTWGIAGLEYAYEEDLLGTPGSMTYEKGGGNVVIPTGVQQESPAIPGDAVVTTIDRDLQWQVQERLEKGVAQTGAEWGVVIVMDVHTGEVYVLADSSVVDPNHPGRSAAEDRGSRAVSAVFEPGSTGKVITMAALLEEGLATPTDEYIAPYEYTTSNGQTFHDSHEHSRLRLTLTGILAKSSNTGTVQAGELLTVDQRYAYLSAFGFGEATGVGLPGESRGILHDVEDWDGRTRYTVLFGQGVSGTAMQMTQVYATIANGGVSVSPTVVKGFEAANGTFTPIQRPGGERVISEQTADELLLMLESVVHDGTGGAAQVPGYRIAGKTGTAQAADGNGTMEDIVASFIGIAPADDPRIVVSVILYNPTTTIYGGSAAGPIFADVTSDALRALGVPPSETAGTLYPLTWG
ncbi:MAG: penicillin-binding protein 2 [Demequinaceae bacterium]|nr:penicillin-binding protein 2 [Demequinaceae bacterium]